MQHRLEVTHGTDFEVWQVLTHHGDDGIRLGQGDGDKPLHDAVRLAAARPALVHIDPRCGGAVRLVEFAIALK